MNTFTFNWKVILALLVPSIILGPYLFFLLDGYMGPGLVDDPNPFGWFVAITLMLILIIPLIYVGTRTWWSSKSVMKTIINLVIALSIQISSVLLIRVGFFQYQDYQYQQFLKNHPTVPSPSEASTSFGPDWRPTSPIYN